jgi:hypothetical protein
MTQRRIAGVPVAAIGLGRNEELLGETLQPFRQRIFLASKCGMTGVEGKRVIDGRPETLKQTCKDALRRLRTRWPEVFWRAPSRIRASWQRRPTSCRSLGRLRRSICKVQVSAKTLETVERLINAETVSGSRYPPETLAEIDTEVTPHAG